MEHLSHWDWAETFTGHEAAALIVGVDPNDVFGNDISRVGVVLDRLQREYEQAIECAEFECIWGNADERPEKPVGAGLISEALAQHWQAFADGQDVTLENWLKSPRASHFENQRFTRRQIVAWLDAVGGEAVYRFNLDALHAPSEANPSARWPWGSHHTEMLGHLEAAARKFWVNYDPSDNTTKPKNEEVSGWLEKEHKISNAKARAIASILRPEDLPTGPRK